MLLPFIVRSDLPLVLTPAAAPRWSVMTETSTRLLSAELGGDQVSVH